MRALFIICTTNRLIFEHDENLVITALKREQIQ